MQVKAEKEIMTFPYLKLKKKKTQTILRNDFEVFGISFKLSSVVR